MKSLNYIEFIYHYTFFEITKFSKILSKFTLFSKNFENIVKFRKYIRKICKFRKYIRKICNFEKNVNGRWSHYKNELRLLWKTFQISSNCYGTVFNFNKNRKKSQNWNFRNVRHQKVWFHEVTTLKMNKRPLLPKILRHY